MRIGIIHPRMDIKGGAENIVVWLADGLRRRGHSVSIIAEAYDPSLWPDSMTTGLDFRVLPRLKVASLLNSKQVMMWSRARQLKTMLSDFDLITAQHYPAYCWAGRARELGGADCKLVWLCHEPIRRLYPQHTDAHLLQWQTLTPRGVRNEHLEAEAVRRGCRSRSQRVRDERNRRWDAAGAAKCDLVVTNSRFTAGNINRIFGVEPVVCYLGIPLPPEPEYKPGEYVAVLTTLSVMKNVHNVIRAIAELAKRCASSGAEVIPLKIAGRGPEREKLERLARDLGVADKVEFVGGLPDEELPEFLANARHSVYVPIDEPFGLVPVESLAMKTPVVASDHGGPLESIEHGVSGLHVNPFDPSAIADAIAKLWTDLDTNRRLAEQGCARVRQFFSMQAFVDRFEEIIEKQVLARQAVR